MIYSKELTETEKNQISNDLRNELYALDNKNQLGTLTRLDKAAQRHIKAALKGKLYADKICLSWMVKHSIYALDTELIEMFTAPLNQLRNQ